ncbi:anti-sigma factor [Domibacillus sp. DTU_2020_1001157_1_SI_ALB_TIR_016]|uniref:anti-sigma factor n=1 Tax=Domibacillus sp. DTU_2020_1001157_1_SI_ALB_TIR_016 TaxID=3077789 RepID=UPI0028E22496|nr:anti-sigma factor [Domibacillus sp. DTU_2020_1001157_1_SI_ALB_TIR_016]WNS78411.1 anti-sigma factor [Domibacillus sp. DTU_2020_1001157_1_SI_ALB_TIR_016]
MTKEQHQCDKLLDYFNRTLPEAEQTAFEEHLAACPDCQEELGELQMLTEDLPYLAEPVEPNEGMKDRVLAAVFAETKTPEKTVTPEKIEPAPVTKTQPSRKPWPWLQPLLAASLLLSASANAYFLLSDREEVAEPRTASVIRDVQLAATEGFNGSAKATMISENQADSVVLQAEQLKSLSGTEAYQVWLIDESGNKVRAGTFRPNENGSGAVSHAMPEAKNGDWKMIAITLEPTPDSAQPLGDIVLAAEL